MSIILCLSYFLGVFEKSTATVVAITADRCATNKRIAKTLGVQFAVCASQRFKLAVQDVAREQKKVVTSASNWNHPILLHCVIDEDVIRLISLKVLHL